MSKYIYEHATDVEIVQLSVRGVKNQMVMLDSKGRVWVENMYREYGEPNWMLLELPKELEEQS